MKESEAHKESMEAKDYVDNADNKATVRNRYENTLKLILDRSDLLENKKIVLHLVGVGAEQKDANKYFPNVAPAGVQLIEVIRELKKRGKEVEVHVMDYDKKLLDAAVENAKREFPGVEIHAHHQDIAKMSSMPANRAHLTICTHVLQHIDSPSMEAGFYNLASGLRPGGLLLVDMLDIDSLDYLHGDTEKYGLKLRAFRIQEHVADSWGTVFCKASEPKPFSEIWGELHHTAWKKRKAEKVLK